MNTKKQYRSFLKLFTLTIFLGFTALPALAQKYSYGGSAYVFKEDKNGNRSVVNVAIPCSERSEFGAKEKLLYIVKSKVKENFGEKMTSSVNYDIDRCEDPSSENNYKTSEYSGSASVQIKDGYGNVKYLNESITCYDNSSEAYAKDKLLNRLQSKLGSSGVMLTPVSYSISKCNK